MTRSDIPTLDMDQFRRDRHRAGRAARGLSSDAPFQGDPLVELVEELADALNYLEEARHATNSTPEYLRLGGCSNLIWLAWKTLQSIHQDGAG